MAHKNDAFAIKMIFINTFLVTQPAVAGNNIHRLFAFYGALQGITTAFIKPDKNFWQ